MDHRVTKATRTINTHNASATTPAPSPVVVDGAPVEAIDKELVHKEALLLKLEQHLSALKLDAAKLKAASMESWPEEKRWMLGDIGALPFEPIEAEAEVDKIVSLEDADDIVSWALDNWMFMRDLELKPAQDKGYPLHIKAIQDRIVSSDGLEKAVLGQFAVYVISHGRSLVIDSIDPKLHDRGKLKLMRYIVVLSLPEPNAIAIDGKLLGVQARTVFRYAASKDLITKPLVSQSKPLTLLSFLIHIPEEAL